MVEFAMASSQRTDDILALCGIMLRRSGVWTNGTSTLTRREYRSCCFKMRAPIEILYRAVAAPVPGTKRMGAERPDLLRITLNGATKFQVKWDDEGRRRKTKDEPGGRWEFLLRREVSTLQPA